MTLSLVFSHKPGTVTEEQGGIGWFYEMKKHGGTFSMTVVPTPSPISHVPCSTGAGSSDGTMDATVCCAHFPGKAPTCALTAPCPFRVAVGFLFATEKETCFSPKSVSPVNCQTVIGNGASLQVLVNNSDFKAV